MRQPARFPPAPYWAEEIQALWTRLDSRPTGLYPAEARRRLQQWGPNTLQTRRRTTALAVLLAQFKSPLVLMLVFAASVSALVQEWVDALRFHLCLSTLPMTGTMKYGIGVRGQVFENPNLPPVATPILCVAESWVWS